MRIRVLARYVKVYNRRLGHAVRYNRGDTFDADELEPNVLGQLRMTMGPRDGSKALKRLINEHGREWSARETATDKIDWKEPAWFKSQLIPAVEVIHLVKEPRDKRGRFTKEK